MPFSFPLRYRCARTQLLFIYKLYLNCLKPHPSLALHSPTEPKPSHCSSYQERDYTRHRRVFGNQLTPKLHRQPSTGAPELQAPPALGLPRFNPQQAPSGGTPASEPPTSKGLQVRWFKTSQENTKPNQNNSEPTFLQLPHLSS